MIRESQKKREAEQRHERMQGIESTMTIAWDVRLCSGHYERAYIFTTKVMYLYVCIVSVCVYIVNERSRALPITYADHAMLPFTYFSDALMFCLMILHKKN